MFGCAIGIDRTFIIDQANYVNNFAWDPSLEWADDLIPQGFSPKSLIVGVFSEEALWHDKHHAQVTPIRWVCVLADQEQEGSENAYFYSTDPTWAADRIIETYASRWNIEVTFEEVREPCRN